MMNVLTKATKKSSVLAKSIVPRKYPPRSELDEGAGPSHSRDRRDYGRGHNHDNCDRSHSRSPVQSRKNDWRDSKNKKYSYRNKKKSGGAKDSHDNKK